MSGLGQAQTGSLKSTPKLTRINGDDNKKIVYRNLGNNHAYPFIWADTFTVAAGEKAVTVASGIKFHGYDLASYANVVATPLANPGGYFYISKNTTTNKIQIKTTAAPGADLDFDVQIMLGEDADVENLACRGTGSPMPSLP
jgi:hypothetical protein